MSTTTQLKDVSDKIQNPEFTDSINKIKSNPVALKAFLEQEKNNLLNEIEKQKAITFDKVYGDLKHASDVQESTILFDERSKQLEKIQKEVTTQQNNSIQNLLDDKQLAQRKYEMNEWSVQNKKETLFIYSMFFILITGIVFLSALLNIGIISSSLFTALVIPFIVIFIFTVIYRARLTSIYRNNRYWNRRSFDDKSGKIHIPSLCSADDTSLSNTTA